MPQGRELSSTAKAPSSFFDETRDMALHLFDLLLDRSVVLIALAFEHHGGSEAYLEARGQGQREDQGGEGYVGNAEDTTESVRVGDRRYRFAPSDESERDDRGSGLESEAHEPGSELDQ